MRAYADKEIEALAEEAFAAGQEQMRNRAAIAAMEIIRSQGAFLNPINLIGSVGKAICGLDVRALPARERTE